MNKTILACLGIFAAGVIAIIVVVSMWVSYNNQCARLTNQVSAKQTDNENQLSKLDNVLGTAGDVLIEQKNAVMAVATKYAEARGQGGSLFKMVQEAIPNLDQSTYQKLVNLISDENDGFAMHQTELLDLQREFNNLVDTWPSRLFVHTFGKYNDINVVVVTTSAAHKSFQTGRDDFRPSIFKNNNTGTN